MGVEFLHLICHPYMIVSLIFGKASSMKNNIAVLRTSANAHEQKPADIHLKRKKNNHLAMMHTSCASIKMFGVKIRLIKCFSIEC